MTENLSQGWKLLEDLEQKDDPEEEKYQNNKTIDQPDNTEYQSKCKTWLDKQTWQR